MGEWEHFAHGADIGVRGIGPTREQAFEQAAMALTAVVTQPARVAASERVEMRCEAPDDELLLAEWLNHIIFEMATRRMLFGRFSVRLAPGELTGEAWGEPVDIARHGPAVEVKGATYTELKVVNSNAGWIAQTVVDV